MNDLISRKDVIDLINRFVFVGYQEPNKEIREEFIKHIKEIPTAYDLEGVIEKLEELREMVPVNRLLDDIVKDRPKDLGQLMAYRKAIEIVKSGGVADE